MGYTYTFSSESYKKKILSIIENSCV